MNFVPQKKDMNIKKITDKEKQIIYRVAEQYQEKGTITNACPRCGGKLTYILERIYPVV